MLVLSGTSITTAGPTEAGETSYLEIQCRALYCQAFPVSMTRQLG